MRIEKFENFSNDDLEQTLKSDTNKIARLEYVDLQDCLQEIEEIKEELKNRVPKGGSVG